LAVTGSAILFDGITRAIERRRRAIEARTP